MNRNYDPKDKLDQLDDKLRNETIGDVIYLILYLATCITFAFAFWMWLTE